MRHELNRMLDEIFKSTNDSLAEMARQSGLCYETVRRLDVRATKSPMFRTVWKLAEAYGYTVQMVAIKKGRMAS